MKKLLKIGLLALLFLLPTKIKACSRVVFANDAGIVMVGRTLDWRTPIPTNLYVYQAGIKKESMPRGPRLSWISKYTSVVAVSYDGGVTEGMNDQGLVMNGLFCRSTVYSEAKDSDKTPLMSLSMLVSYFLDNFAKVKEVEYWLKNNSFVISGTTFDGGTVSTLHWAITDTTGNTLILEYEDGEFLTYCSPHYRVLTNDPPYLQMTAINTYWQGVGGQNMLPGTVRSADRFVRASYFIEHLPLDVDSRTAFAELSGVIDNVSVPYGYEISGEANLSSTQWRSIADAGALTYYFRMANSYGYFWLDLRALNENSSSGIFKLDTAKNPLMTGCVNDNLEPSKGFTPMW
jgi:choloylglycine hydrolase